MSKAPNEPVEVAEPLMFPLVTSIGTLNSTEVPAAGNVTIFASDSYE